MRFLLRSLCCCVLWPAFVASARALTVDPGDDDSSPGVSCSAAIVEGRPAIAYANARKTAIKYVRALDAAGSVWGPPVAVDSGPSVGTKVILLTVNGNPAVCYFNSTVNRLMFARA